ncbi:16420_t:CDS:2 [Entrophospora sp. SA101]|nr:16420_t:CDS:2 [Entrophospora sp. SA101]CAJ0842078.1 5553_t:CDS:2 [Entrophospora sp. SA101]
MSINKKGGGLVDELLKTFENILPEKSILLKETTQLTKRGLSALVYMEGKARFGAIENKRHWKIMFFNGLSLDNKKVLIRFGMDKPLDELVEHLERILASQTDGTKFMFRKMIQDPVQYLTSIQA